MFRRILQLVAVGLVAGSLLAACSRGDAVDGTAEAPPGSPSSVSGPATAPGRETAEPGRETSEQGQQDAVEEEPLAEPIQEPVDAGDPLPRAPGDRVIKEGVVTVEVESFDAAFRSVVDAAARLGGTVVASTSSTADHGTSGTVTVRVPVDEYEELLTGIDDVGDVVQRDITARDVTTEYTDLESRLRHLRAQERFYLELLEDAESVADAVTLRQQLDELQADVEQVRGRLQLLEDRTAYSTLTVELVEAGAPLLASGPAARPSLAEYWERARDAFTSVVGVMLVTLFFLAPLALPAALAFAAWRTFRPRPTPAVAEGE